jgi:thiamine-phosphate pyrophosphorylase
LPPIGATSRNPGLEQPIRYGISDRRLFPDLAPEAYLERLVATSATVIQLREKDLERSALMRLAKLGLRLSRTWNKTVILNTDVELAIEIGADGVHLPSVGNPEAARRRAHEAGRPDFLIGWSIHEPDEVLTEERRGVDYVLLAPVFSPISKAGRNPLGLMALRDACRRSRVPVIALGGITSDRVESVLEAGAAGFAGISWVADEIRRAGQSRA